MANLMDFCECLAKEGRLAQDYVKFIDESKNEESIKRLKQLEKLSIEQMKILHGIIVDYPWVLEVEEETKSKK